MDYKDMNAIGIVRLMLTDGVITEEQATKYFPELKESEDKESKKWILEYLYNGLRKSDEQFKGQFKAAIAWLEKQGEQTYVKWSYDEGKQIQINPSEYINDMGGNGCYLKNPEQDSTWSEEDEMIALSIEQVMNCASLLNIVPEKIDKIRTWLKSLKDRVAPQPKQGWSEEDKKMLDYALDMIEWYGGKNEDKSRLVSDWLKSLRPQKHWKPTEAQLASLEIACDRNDRVGFDLTELLKGLKKYGGCSMLSQWKPSDGQMEALHTYIYNPQYFSSPDPRMELVESVYKDLKRLKGE